MNTTTHKIFIVSGPVQSGKTTRLMKWAKKRKDVSGIFSPVIEGKRFFMNAATNEIFPMEKNAEELSGLKVGKYILSLAAFNRANEILQNALITKSGWIIIDEIGPLELNGKGFYDTMRQIMMQKNKDCKIILVIREFLLDEILKYFEIAVHKKFNLSST